MHGVKPQLNPSIGTFILTFELFSEVVSLVYRRHQTLRKRNICVQGQPVTWKVITMLRSGSLKCTVTVVRQLVLCPSIVDYIEQIRLSNLRVVQSHGHDRHSFSRNEFAHTALGTMAEGGQGSSYELPCPMIQSSESARGRGCWAKTPHRCTRR